MFGVPAAIACCSCAQEGVADFSNLGVRAATQLDPYFLQFAPQSAALADVQPATLGFVVQPCVTGEAVTLVSCIDENSRRELSCSAQS